MRKVPSFFRDRQRGKGSEKNGSAGPEPVSVRHRKFLEVNHGQRLAEEISLYLVALT
jgi:hypothetical protein